MSSSESPPRKEAPLPERIAGYRIESRLGRGGMGDVFLGIGDDESRAAVKVLPAELSRETGFLARFEREVETLERLDHPHIVRLIEHGTHDGVPFIAMEYAEGRTLLERLQAERRIGWREAIAICLDVCDALRHAHALGVIHRDLKPSNLMLTPTAGVKLLDFGVAQVFNSGDRLTATGGVVGTAEFMSPEQADGRRVTGRSDLYSLGAVLYAMLTGRPPFSGPSMLDVIHKHRFARCDSVRRYDPAIPTWLDALVVELLEKEPSKRPPDARVLANRLREIPKKVDLAASDPDTAEDRAGPTVAGVTDPAATVAGDAEMFGDLEGLGDESDAEHHATVATVGAATRTASRVDGETGDVGLRGPGEATIMRNLLVAELTERDKHPVAKAFESVWVLLALLAAVVAGGVAWFSWQHVSPEEHFERARAILAEPPSPRWLLAVREHLEPLLEEDPIFWAPAVEPLVAKVERWNATRPRGLSRLTEAIGFADADPAADAFAETAIDAEEAPAVTPPPAETAPTESSAPADLSPPSDLLLDEAERLVADLEAGPALPTADDLAAARLVITSGLGTPDEPADRLRADALLRRLDRLGDRIASGDPLSPLLRATLAEIARLAETDPAAARRVVTAARRLYDDPASLAAIDEVAEIHSLDSPAN